MRRSEKIRSSLSLGIICAAYLCAVTAPSSAIIFNDSSVNDTAPTGEFADNGWQWAGSWGVGAGTAVSPKCFVTAKHFSTGSDTFTLTDGSTYTRVSYIDDPNSDLRIVTIAETFSTWAPLYTSQDEVGKDIVVVGRGYSQGEEIPGNGWKPSTQAGIMRWGTNVASGFSNYPVTGGASKLLSVKFDTPGSAGDTEYEAGIVDRDSGGGVFINDGGVWKLAGVNYSVDGPFDDDIDHSDGGFYGALYDKSEMWQKKGFVWQYIPESTLDNPSSWYATRISRTFSWIQSNLTSITPGDANGDGAVDLDDFGILKSNFGTAGGWSEGDFDGSGMVDLDDFDILKSNFGTAVGDALNMSSTVPEPCTLALMGIASSVLIRRRRRISSR